MILYREHHTIIEFFCYFFKINERLTYKFNKREYTFDTKYYMKQIKKKHHILLKPLWHYARKRNVRQHQQSECVFCHWLLRIVYVCSHFRLVVWAKSTTLKKIWIKNLKILSEIFAQFFIYICLESELLFI